MADTTGFPGSLPTPFTSFVGRRTEVAEVRRLLGASRLVTLKGMPVSKIAGVTFTSDGRVRDVIHNSTPTASTRSTPSTKAAGPKTFLLPERREIKKIAESKPAERRPPWRTLPGAALGPF
jgi:hypothetical protein